MKELKERLLPLITSPLKLKLTLESDFHKPVNN